MKGVEIDRGVEKDTGVEIVTGITGKIFAIGHDEMEYVEGKGTGRLIAGCVLEVLKTSSLQG